MTFSFFTHDSPKGKSLKFNLAFTILLLLIFSNATFAADPPGASKGRPNETKRNIILIFTDDQGYGDLGCFGAEKIATPNIDRMATQGMRFTSYYSAASVCTPSRAALMTGCYPERVGNLPVLFPHSDRGLNPKEQTVAELLRDAGYATACIGKWHLGHHAPFLPTNHGFDEYFGIPYSNDMKIDRGMKFDSSIVFREQLTLEQFQAGKSPGPPLMRGSASEGCRVIECPANQRTLTKRYTHEAIQFIDRAQSKEKPFFIYLPHTMPHIPLFASDDFRGKSEAGLYGDTLEEIDWSVGQILKHLKDKGLDENTIVIYTSDNGPWNLKGSKEAWVKGNMKRNVGGSAGPLRGFKFSNFEGGMREPTVIWGPGLVAKGKVCDHIVGSIDVLPTLVEIAAAQSPEMKIDGKSIVQILKKGNDAEAIRDTYFYRTEGVRHGDWKLKGKELFNLKKDIGESTNVAESNPDVVRKLSGLLQAHRDELKKNARKAGSYLRPEQKIEGSKTWRAQQGKWKLVDGVLANASSQGETLAFSESFPSKDFELRVQARKLKGKEGFRILVRANKNQSIRWSLGAFGNQQHSLMRVQRNKVRKRSEPVTGKIEEGKWYELVVRVEGRKITCRIDGELANEASFDWNRAGMIGLGSNQAQVEYKEFQVLVDGKPVSDGWNRK